VTCGAYAILSAVHDNPRATEDEQEQGPERIEQEEEMRGPSGADRVAHVPGRGLTTVPDRVARRRVVGSERLALPFDPLAVDVVAACHAKDHFRKS